MIRIALIVSILAFTIGCKPDHHDHGDAHAEVCTDSVTSDEYAKDDVVPQPGAKIGDLARCPISSSVFRISETSPKTEHKGETYYTCCGGCIAQLEQSFARRK